MKFIAVGTVPQTDMVKDFVKLDKGGYIIANEMMETDIPGIFAAYNRRYAEGRFWSFVDYVMCTSLRNNSTAASNCIGCGKCEKHCPQGINIREQLRDAKKEFEGPVYKTACKVLKRFTRF